MRGTRSSTAATDDHCREHPRAVRRSGSADEELRTLCDFLERLAAGTLATRLRAMPFYQRLGDVPRKRHVQFRDNGTLLTEEVMGLEGFDGERVDPLPPDVSVPRREARRLRADRAQGMGAGRAPAAAHEDVGRRRRRRRARGTAAADVERRRRDLALPADRGDGLLLPQRRGRRGDLRPRGLRDDRVDLRPHPVQARRLRRHPSRDDVPRRRRTTASSAISCSSRRG